MRPIIITSFVSLDGVMQAPGAAADYRNGGWTYTAVDADPASYELKRHEQEAASALLLGRRSYVEFAPVAGSMELFAGYGTLQRFVVSATMERDDDRWPATILRSLDEVAALKHADGGPILVHGSGTLGKALLNAGLVDRLHLLVFPVLLGAGMRLFDDADADATRLALVEHEAYSNGIVKHVYDIVR